MKKFKKPLLTGLKVAISLAFIYMVYTQVPFKQVWKVYQNANIGYLLLAILSFVMSQWVSSKRLLMYFRTLDFDLPDIQNQRLYLIGMFYNFFIPGGVGGDAYKVYFLNKTYGWSLKKLGKAVFMDRLMGFGVIIILLVLFISMVDTIPTIWRVGSAFLALFGLGFSYFLMKMLGKSFIPIWSKVVLLSFFIQSLQLLSITFILLSLGVVHYFLAYFISFLLSSIIGLISIGGIGIREFVFLQVSNYLPVDQNTSVAVGLMFTLITALISLGGLYYHLFEKKYFPVPKT